MVAKTPRVRFWRWTPSLKEWRQGRCAFSQNQTEIWFHLKVRRNLRGNFAWKQAWGVTTESLEGEFSWSNEITGAQRQDPDIIHCYTNAQIKGGRSLLTANELQTHAQSPYQSNIQQYPLLELKDNVLKLKPEDKQKNFKPRVILRTFLVQPALRRLLDGLKGSHLGCHKTLCKVQARLWRPGPASAVEV